MRLIPTALLLYTSLSTIQAFTLPDSDAPTHHSPTLLQYEGLAHIQTRSKDTVLLILGCVKLSWPANSIVPVPRVAYQSARFFPFWSSSLMNYDIFREELAVKYPAYGHGLWEPSPRGQYTAVEIGDVGFIRDGYFHRLFNVLLPEDHPSHQDGVPQRHEPLVLRTRLPTSIGTLQPNDLRSNGVSDRSDGSGRWASG